MIIFCEFESSLSYMNFISKRGLGGQHADLREGRKGKENFYVKWRKSAFKTVLSSLVKAKRKQFLE